MNVQVINNWPVKIWTDTVEDSAMQQIENLTTLPFLFHHLAIMPDVHCGFGMPIGGVLACRDAVVPNAVGVDIGCGMCAVKTNVKYSRITKKFISENILTKIRERVPLDTEHHKEAQDEKYMPEGYDLDRLHVVGHQYDSARRQVGTLGGGNHFIELQKDEQGYMWIMIHSGSRNLGKQVGDYYNKVARQLNAIWYSSVDPSIKLPFLPLKSEEFSKYWAEMEYCIDFAFCNRKLIMQRIEEIISDALPRAEFEPMINIAHNYAKRETHFNEDVIIHRKGATSAYKGEIGIIPGSQGSASYIVEGLGNKESFCSCSHGAGRAMSRKMAIDMLDIDEENKRLRKLGVIHKLQDKRELQEAASAYKDIETVMANEADLVKIKNRLMPVAVIKGV